jgi:hypothetical protein
MASAARFAGASVGAGSIAWRVAPALAAMVQRSRRRSTAPWIAAGAGLLGLGLARWQLQRVFAAEPLYTVEVRARGLEIRRYASSRVAETSVIGEWGNALDEGFRRLAGFLFGRNARGRSIAMIAPMTVAREGDGYRLAYTMPEGLDLPRPDDDRVIIRAAPERRVAVLRFGGRRDDASVEARKNELLAVARQRGFVARGEPTYAAYDPPSTIPWLRRNEVWVEIER